MTGACTGSPARGTRRARRHAARCARLARLTRGPAREVAVSEALPRAALADPLLARLLAEDCAPFDPYLPPRLDAVGSRMLVASEDEQPLAFGLVVPEVDEMVLPALACVDLALGQRALEPVIAAALMAARRIRKALKVLVPPHQDHALLLLDLLGFERRGRDRHGRETFCHALEDRGSSGGRWTGLAPADPAAEAPASTLLRQLLRTQAAREPAAGDLLLLFHARAADGIRSASLRPRRGSRASVTRAGFRNCWR